MYAQCLDSTFDPPDNKGMDRICYHAQLYKRKSAHRTDSQDQFLSLDRRQRAVVCCTQVDSFLTQAFQDPAV